MKVVMILAVIALVLFAWMFRYEVSGHVGWGASYARPVMLDRWTGKTYIYYQVEGETAVIGGWVQTKPEPAWMRDPIVKP